MIQQKRTIFFLIDFIGSVQEAKEKFEHFFLRSIS